MKKLGLLSVLLIGTCLNLNSSDTRSGTPDGTPRERRSATPVGARSSKSTPSTGGSSVTTGSNGSSTIVRFNPLTTKKDNNTKAGAGAGSRSVRRDLSTTFDGVVTAGADEAQGWSKWFGSCCSSMGTGCAAAASAVWNKGFCGRARCYRRANEFVVEHPVVRRLADFGFQGALSALISQYEPGLVLEVFATDNFGESIKRNFEELAPTMSGVHRLVITVAAATGVYYVEMYIMPIDINLGFTKALTLAVFRQIKAYFEDVAKKSK